MAHLVVFGALLLICSGYALLCGGAPERITAAIFLTAAAVTSLTLPPILDRFISLDVEGLIIDAAMLAAFIVLAVRADRFWTLWIAAFQGAQVLSHLVGLTGMPRLNLTYAILSQVYCYPMLGLLAVGTFRHRRRLARYGADSSWSRSSASARQPPPWNAPSG